MYPIEERGAMRRKRFAFSAVIAVVIGVGPTAAHSQSDVEKRILDGIAERFEEMVGGIGYAAILVRKAGVVCLNWAHEDLDDVVVGMGYAYAYYTDRETMEVAHVWCEFYKDLKKNDCDCTTLYVNETRVLQVPSDAAILAGQPPIQSAD